MPINLLPTIILLYGMHKVKLLSRVDYDNLGCTAVLVFHL